MNGVFKNQNLFLAMDSYQLVVGSKDCPLTTVASIIRQSPIIQKEWTTFAIHLGLDNEEINRYKQKLLHNQISVGDLILDVIEIWRERNQLERREATLANLLQVVEGACEVNDVGESLRLVYNLPCKEAEATPSLEWKDLSPIFKTRVIENFQNVTTTVKHTEVLPKLRGAPLVNLMRGKKPRVLGLPEQLSYYVCRTIETRNIISGKIFDQNSTDIFLFIGLDPYELSVLARGKLTCSTGGQVQLQNGSDVKFMILDQPSHFDKICGKTNHPVHLLKREENGKLRWMKSKGGMNNLQEYIDKEEDELAEEQLSKLNDSQLNPVLISGTPGMGKSTMLAHLGHKLVQLYPYKTVLFTTFREFIKLAKSFETEDKVKLVELTLQKWIGEVQVIPQSKMNLVEEAIVIELLLDGWDELEWSDWKLGFEIIRAISQSFKCVRLWITTRPHSSYNLESNFNVSGYNIRPFHEENQVKFLTSFWSRQRQLKDQEKVELFARQCLKATMSSTVNDIIPGIPLHCLLIGEVYEDDAVEFAKLGRITPSYNPNTGRRERLLINMMGAEFKIEMGTIANLCEQLVKMKFEKYKSAFENAKLSEDEFMSIHSHLSLEILFPVEHESFGLTKTSEVDIDEVMKGGMITSTGMGIVTFIHRVYAEYFVARYMFDKLQIDEEYFFSSRSHRHLYDFLLLIVRFVTVILPEHTILLHPMIVYFLNSMVAKANLPTEILATYAHRQMGFNMIKSTCAKGKFV